MMKNTVNLKQTMKPILIITAGFALLFAGNQAANAQGRTRQPADFQTQTRGRTRQGGFGYGPGGYAGAADPRTMTFWPNSPYGTNGFDIIAINNIFNPSRVYVPPRTNVVPLIPTYNFTVDGIMTDDAHSAGYVFFYGNSVQNRAYTNSETINGFKISEIVSNTVTLVDTNNKSFMLAVGSGFSKTGSNDWRFLPVPSASSYVATTSGDEVSSGGDDSEPTGPMSEAMKRLIERRKQELGDAQNGTTTTGAPDDAGPVTVPPPGGDAPAPPPEAPAP